MPYKVDIAAGGASSRLRPALMEFGYETDYPKHLLLTGNPGGETLLGRIVNQAFDDLPSAQPVIHASEMNAPFIRQHPDIDDRAAVVTGHNQSAFAPFMGRLMKGRRTLGASGDHYAETFDWQGLLEHHESAGFPATLVAGQCQEVDEGAVFDVADNGQVERFYRPDRTDSESLINIGIYVFDPAKVLMRSLEKIGVRSDDPKQAATAKPEEVVNQMIANNLLGAYVLPPRSSFNVNTLETYHGLLRHTAMLADDGAKIA